MPFYLKCRFCLFPKAKYIHLDRNRLSFTSLMTNTCIFRFFAPFSLNYNQNNLGYCLIERWCCQEIMPFYLKCQFYLGPELKTYIYTLKSSVFYKFDDMYISFLDVLELSLLKCDQNILEYCFSERWCCQKRHVFSLNGSRLAKMKKSIPDMSLP